MRNVSTTSHWFTFPVLKIAHNVGWKPTFSFENCFCW